MVDIHCHILPEIDDGPSCMEDALEMARIAASDGIRQMVATPHVTNSDYPPELISRCVVRFNEALEACGIPLKVLPGAEICAGLNTHILKDFSINNTPYFFLEFPHSHMPKNANEIVFNALLAGLKPIIPHPERNPSVMRKPKIIFELVEAGALVQITAESLTGGFGIDASECAKYLLKKNAVHFLASDGHSPRQRRPILSQGFEVAARIIGEAAARRLVTINPAAMITGNPVYG